MKNVTLKSLAFLLLSFSLSLTQAKEILDDSDFIFPNSHQQELTANDFQNKKLYQLRRGLNEIYARHGRLFTNDAIHYYFEKKTWYKGDVLPKDFHEELLNSYEIINTEKLREELNHRTQGLNVTQLEKTLIRFLNENGVNGFLQMRFNLHQKKANLPLYDLVYQLVDYSIDFDLLHETIEKQYSPINTDITYISRKNLDLFLKRTTGYGLQSKMWDTSSVAYVKGLDVYFVEHGDTNRLSFSAELYDMKENQVQLLCFPQFTSEPTPFIVTFNKTKEGTFQIKSILDVSD